jgi:hypothetical protein
MKNLSTESLIQILSAYETIKKQAAILGVPAFETKTEKGIMKAEAFEHYKSLLKEILKRDDSRLYQLQSEILKNIF